MAWVKGQSGNPGGRLKGESELQALARQHAPAAIKALVKALDDERLCVAAASALLDRGYGRPAQRIDANVTVLDQLDATELRRLEATLAAIAQEEGGPSAGSATTH